MAGFGLGFEARVRVDVNFFVFYALGIIFGRKLKDVATSLLSTTL